MVCRHHLTERIAYENATRAKKMEFEDNQVRKETSVYLEQVDKAKKRAAMGEKRAKKRKADGVAEPKAREHAVRQRKPITEA